jgi:hypothetical protein
MGLGGYFAAPGTIIGWQEGEELQANLLQASQRIPANSSVPDEVFGIHSRLAGEEVQMAPSAARFPCGQGTLQNRGRLHVRDPE